MTGAAAADLPNVADLQLKLRTSLIGVRTGATAADEPHEADPQLAYHVPGEGLDWDMKAS